MKEIEYFSKAKEYLLSFDKISQEMIDTQLSEWKKRKPKNLKELFRAFIKHAQNRQSMPNSIGDISKLSSVLLEFNHIEII